MMQVSNMQPAPSQNEANLNSDESNGGNSAMAEESKGGHKSSAEHDDDADTESVGFQCEYDILIDCHELTNHGIFIRYW